MKQFIVKMPVNFDYEENPINCALGCVAGTTAIDGFELKLICTDDPSDFDVLATEGEEINQLNLLPYYLDVPITDENGEITGTEPVTDLTGKIQTFAGRKWLY